MNPNKNKSKQAINNILILAHRVLLQAQQEFNSDLPVLVEITPQMAENFLDSSPGNRDMTGKKSRQRITHYQKLMESGKWHKSDLRFDKQGQLRDGHHRMVAQILAGVTLFYFIRFNVDESEFVHMDTGLSRNPLDAATMSKEYEVHTKEHEVILKQGLSEGGYEKLPQDNQSILDLLEKYKDHLETVISCFYRTEAGVSKGPVKGAFFRAAIYGMSKKRLKLAAEYLLNGPKPCGEVYDGLTKEQETTLNALRKWLQKAARHGVRDPDIYQRVTTYLASFGKSQLRSKMTKANFKIDHFPLDEPLLTSVTSSLNPQLTLSIRRAFSNAKDNEKFTLEELGKRLCEAGVCQTATDPPAAACTKFRNLANKSPGKAIIIKNFGVLKPENPDATRIHTWVFHANLA